MIEFGASGFQVSFSAFSGKTSCAGCSAGLNSDVRRSDEARVWVNHVWGHKLFLRTLACSMYVSET